MKRKLRKGGRRERRPSLGKIDSGPGCLSPRDLQLLLGLAKCSAPRSPDPELGSPPQAGPAEVKC